MFLMFHLELHIKDFYFPCSFSNFTEVCALAISKISIFSFQCIVHSIFLICPPLRYIHSFSLTAKFPITLLRIPAGIALVNLVIADFSS